MTEGEVRQRVKEIIANITGLEVSQIGDDAAFVDDLDLDSLTLLEIGVDVDFEFKLGLPEERMREAASVDDTVTLVQSRLAEREADEGAPALAGQAGGG